MSHELDSPAERAMINRRNSVGPSWLQKTACEALGEYNSAKRRGEPYPCPHDRLDEIGICRQCGKDCRGIG